MPVAVVTGANRGIGLELAKQLSSDHEVIGVCRQGSPELEQLGIRVESGIDITQRDDLQRLAENLAEISIDLLINNAGLMRPSSLAGIERELADWRAQFEVNALAPLRVTSALLSRLQSGGKVVIITSRMGSIADNTSGGSYAYRMSKAAVNAAAMSLAHELAGRQIAVGLLHPGYVRTDMTGGHGQVEPEESAANLIRRIQELDLTSSGHFRHANGEALPW